MADFFQRLSEHTIYHRTGVQPLFAPHFAAPTIFNQPLFGQEREQQATAELTDAPHELAGASPGLMPLVAQAATTGATPMPALQLRQLAGNRSQPLPPSVLPAPTAQAARPSAEGVAMTTVGADALRPDNHRVVATDSLPGPARPVDEVVATAPVQVTTLRAPTAATDQPPATNVPAEAATVAAAGPNSPAIGATHQQQMIGQTTTATALQPNRSTAHRTAPISPLVPTPAAERRQPTAAESTLERALVTPAAAGRNNDQLSPAPMRPVLAPAVVGERTVATAPLVPSVTDASPAVAVGSAVNQPGAAALQPLVPMAQANMPLVQRTPLVAPGTTPVKQAGTAPTAPSPRRTMVPGQMGGEQTTTSGAVGPTHQPRGIAGDPSALGRGGEAGMAPLAQSQQHDSMRANFIQPFHEVRRGIGAVSYPSTPIDIADQLNWPAQSTQPAQQGDNFAVMPLPLQLGVALPSRQPATGTAERPSLGATVPTQGATTQGATTQGATTQGAVIQGAVIQGAVIQGASTSASPTMAPVRPNETTARLPTLVAAERTPAAVRTAPTIQITIGRIEVRTASEPPAAPRRATRTALSLDEYLQKTQRRSR